MFFRDDTTRISFTIPLRESFGFPFLFAQIAFITFFFKKNVSSLAQVHFVVIVFIISLGRHGGLMVNALVSRSSRWGLSPGHGHCVVFLKTLYSHSASLHPGVQMGGGELLAGDDPAMDKDSIEGRVEILLVASCYRNKDKFRPDGPLSSYADFTFYILPLPMNNCFIKNVPKI